MSVTGIKLEGFENFLSMVKDMPDKMKAKTMAKIMETNLKPVALAIKNQTPIGKRIVNKRKRKSDGKVFETTIGNLRRSIGTKAFWGKNEPTAYAGIQKKGADGWYGLFIERGTKHIAKNPFISRAASMTVPLAAENLQTDIKNYIVKNAQKLGLDAK
jgi:hypothetical protein